MTGTAIGALLLELGLIVLMAVFSAAESALRAARRPQTLEQLAEGETPARRTNLAVEHASRSVAAIVIADFFTTFALAAVAAAYLAPQLSDVLRALFGELGRLYAVVLVVAVVSVLAIVFGLFLPRAIAARHPAVALAALAVPVRIVTLLLTPVIGVLFGATRVLGRPFGASPESGAMITAEDLKALVETGEEQGVIEEEEREMIHSIFEFGEKVAHEVMVPRTDIVGIEAGSPLREALDMVVRAAYSRIPVYRDNLDDIIGILYVKDLFRHVAKGRLEIPLTDIVRPAHFVPETKKVAELLREMQERKVHLAIVVDEYGGTAGLITIEDLVEEIVGEIRDEFEVDEQRIVAVSEHEALMDARVPFDDVVELFDPDVERSEDYDTLGGFIAHELGRMPRVGDTVRRGGVVFSVESMHARRASKVRVKREEPAEARPPGGGRSV